MMVVKNWQNKATRDNPERLELITAIFFISFSCVINEMVCKGRLYSNDGQSLELPVCT